MSPGTTQAPRASISVVPGGTVSPGPMAEMRPSATTMIDIAPAAARAVAVDHRGAADDQASARRMDRVPRLRGDGESPTARRRDDEISRQRMHRASRASGFLEAPSLLMRLRFCGASPAVDVGLSCSPSVTVAGAHDGVFRSAGAAQGGGADGQDDSCALARGTAATAGAAWPRRNRRACCRAALSIQFGCGAAGRDRHRGGPTILGGVTHHDDLRAGRLPRLPRFRLVSTP